MYVRCWMTIDCLFEFLHQRHYLILSTTDDATGLVGNGLVCVSHGTTEWPGLRPPNGLALQWGWVEDTNIKILLQTNCGLLSMPNIDQPFLQVCSDTDKQLSTISSRPKLCKQLEKSSTAITWNDLRHRGWHWTKNGGGLWHNTHTMNKVNMVQCAGT